MTVASVDAARSLARPTVSDAVGLPVRRWIAWLSVPALLIGVAAYPIVSEGAMPLPVALLILLAVAALIVVRGNLRLLILLPLVAAFLPSAQVGFAAYLLTLGYFAADHGAARFAQPLDRVDWAMLAVLGWAAFSWLANLGDQTDLWSLPVFVITFLSPWLLLFIARAVPWRRGEIPLVAGAWLAATMAQAVPSLLKPVLIGETSAYTVPLVAIQVTGVGLLRSFIPGGSSDLTTGTMTSAHHLGATMLLAIAMLIALRMAVRGTRILGVLVLLGFVFLMTDSKHIVLAALPAGLIFGRAVLWRRLAPRTRRVLNVSAIVLALGAGAYVGPPLARFVVDGLWRPYMVLATLNPKVLLYTRTADLLAQGSPATWIGFGPGVYASRAASIRATSVLFKEENRLPSFIPAHTGRAYGSVAYDLYTSEIVATEKDRSGALTSPFSSLVGIVGEFGLLGAAVVFWFLWTLARAGFAVWRKVEAEPVVRAAGAALGFGVPLLVVMGLFDTYFEQPAVTASLVLLAVIALAGGRSEAADTPRDRATAPTIR